MPLPADNPNKLRDAYACLGLQPEASMPQIEAAYWQFARELRGQPAMAAYTQAYEVLVNRSKPLAVDARETPAAAPDVAPEPARPAARPPSKFGWPSS